MVAVLMIFLRINSPKFVYSFYSMNQIV